MRVTAIICSLLSLSALGCDDDESNASCERGCARDYLAAVDSCEDDATACMAGCSSPDDSSCMWDCDDLAMECDFEMIMCMSGCPCLEKVQDCATGCGQDDMDCYQTCSDKYLDCAGTDSAYNCINMCSPDKYSCLWDCEDTADMSDYLDCRADCHAGYTGCLGDCV